jgi:hypothetical protein
VQTHFSSLLRVVLCIAIAALLAGLTGCANVKPWERDALAREDMSWDPDPQWSQLQGHIRFSKEAGMPGNSGGGGGCGCN